MRAEHYPYWTVGRIAETAEVPLPARGSADRETIKVIAGPENSARHDTLGRDDNPDGLFAGRLVNIPLSLAIGGTTLHFEASTVTDLWLVLTW
ncbi:hypothetical protein [Streptomyces sp. NPDC096339]|uniref:hypothetical protein n=1 Tax=Streptomyces sp. NPDC096339 TaxID=3366086 RepID=UPI003813619C